MILFQCTFECTFVNNEVVLSNLYPDLKECITVAHKYLRDCDPSLEEIWNKVQSATFETVDYIEHKEIAEIDFDDFVLTIYKYYI